MEITDKLKDLGFKLKNYNNAEIYVYKTEGKISGGKTNDRFTYDFVYYIEDNIFYINCYLMRGLETISESELLQNFNGLNTVAKEKWLEIKCALKDYEYEVYE